jgi:Prokaryotic membrane lipoprotein lipid attachment site.
MKIMPPVNFMRIILFSLGALTLISCSSKTPSPSVIKEYSIPIPANVPYAGSIRSAVYSLDDIFWFTEPVTNNIGKYDVAAGKFSTYPVTTRGAAPDGICIGEDTTETKSVN